MLIINFRHINNNFNQLIDILAFFIYSMGQSYCNQCCNDKDLTQYQNYPSIQLSNKQDHSPLAIFGIPVKQTIELSGNVKDIYQTYRSANHFAQRSGGIKLQTYYLYNYSAYYQGQWRNGLPHGHGKLIYDDGALYQGCFKQGYAQCKQALYITSKGAFYRGQVNNNKANGHGQLYTTKFYYKGIWKNDLPNGKGRQVYSQQSYFQGDFNQGKKQGKGVYTWNSNQYYTGEFHNNLMDGKGQIVLKDFIYKGEFLKGQKSGKGLLQNLTNNWTYDGQFLNNQMNGIGTYLWSDGTKFQGRFLNNQRTNQGIIILSNKQVINCSKTNIN